MPQSVDLAFERFGGESPATPLLILHGFFASSRNWRGIARQLAERRSVFVLDMRNHGVSPTAEPMDYPSMAADVLAFMARQGMEKVDLLGHSMGGKVAMWLALHNPEWIDHLIVADIAPVSYQHCFDNTIDALRALPLHILSNRKQAESALADGIPDLDYRQFLLQNLQLQHGCYHWRIDLEVFARNAHHIVAFPDASGLVYAQSVLFLAGEHSGYVSADAVYRHFSLAQIVEIADAGHWLHVQQPQAFCRAVEAFLLP
jgi:esterase